MSAIPDMSGISVLKFVPANNFLKCSTVQNVDRILSLDPLKNISSQHWEKNMPFCILSLVAYCVTIL